MTSPVVLNGRLVQPAERINFIPVFADVSVLKSDVVGAISAPARSATAGIEALALHHEFGDARDRLADSARFVRRELADADAVTPGVVAAIEPRQGHAIGVPDHVAFGIFPDQGPGRLEPAALHKNEIRTYGIDGQPGTAPCRRRRRIEDHRLLREVLPSGLLLGIDRALHRRHQNPCMSENQTLY